MTGRSSRRIGATAVAAAALLAAAGVAGPASSAEVPVFRYAGGLAQRGSTPIATDGSGAGNAAVVSQLDGAVIRSTVAAGDGDLSYELAQSSTPCATAPCPQIVLLPSSSPAVNLSPFSFGAEVYLLGDPVASAGENVIQHGLAMPGESQWKLQVDWHKPTCRFSDGSDVVLIPAPADRVTIASKRWYSITCRRSGAVFSITVVDQQAGRTILSRSVTDKALGAIRPSGSITIGAKKATAEVDAQTDQLRGRLDNVTLRIG